MNVGTERSKQFISSIENYALVLLFGAILLITIVQPLDGDTWWHLRAGEITLAQHHPLMIDVFSYTKFGEAWASHEWLSELWMYLFYKIGGFTGLSVWISLLGFATAILLYRMMKGPRLYRALLTLVAILLLIPFFKARPQMVTLVCILLVGLILQHFRMRKGFVLLWLIPLFMVWANMHGGFVIGFIYILIFMIGDAIDQYWYGSTAEDDYLTRKDRILLGLVLIASALVVMIHPLGPGVWATILNTVNPGAGSEEIVEWASPNFHALGQQLYLWTALGILAILALVEKKVKWTDLLLLTFFIASGFIWQRQLSFLAIFGMVILSKYLLDLIQMAVNKLPKLKAKVEQWGIQLLPTLHQRTPGLIRVLFLVLAAMVYAISIFRMYIIDSKAQIQSTEARMFPQEALQWIQTNRPAGRMMNSYNWGGYFDWYLREYPVFLDSRADLFRGQILDQWLDVMNARNGWQAVLEKWQINLVVCEPDWTITRVLPYAGWEERYRDEHAVIFTR